MTVALHVLVALAPLASIALAAAVGTGFAVAYYVLALVVPSAVDLVTAPARTHEPAPDVDRTSRS